MRRRLQRNRGRERRRRMHRVGGFGERRRRQERASLRSSRLDGHASLRAAVGTPHAALRGNRRGWTSAEPTCAARARPSDGVLSAMPTPAHRPPAQLPRSGAFTAAQAHAAGLSRGQLGGRAYSSISRDVWAVADASPLSEAQNDGRDALICSLLTVTPGAVASFVTAAQLLELRLPARLRGETAVHLTRVDGSASPRRKGVIGHRCVIAREDVWQKEGLKATSPLRTFVDLAALRTPVGTLALTDAELVALADGLICAHRTGPRAGQESWCVPGQLLWSLERLAGVHGVARARRAAARAMPAVDSMLETFVRLMLEDHSLTGWETDVELRAPGVRTIHPHLADREHRLSVQVEGPHHDQHRQRERDIERARATEAMGWREIRLTRADLRAGFGRSGVPRAVELIRAARAAAVVVLVGDSSAPHQRR